MIRGSTAAGALVCPRDDLAALVDHTRLPLAKLPRELVAGGIEREVDILGRLRREDIAARQREVNLRVKAILRLGRVVVDQHHVRGDDVGEVFEFAHDSGHVPMERGVERNVAGAEVNLHDAPYRQTSEVGNARETRSHTARFEVCCVMRWSFPIARIAGIEVRIHATFFLLLGWIALMYGQRGGRAAAIEGVIFVCLIFLCVLLHEFGHAIAARRYGIKTPDITLLPIGGLARLERMPDKPSEEVVVALAGPLVNVVIAALLWLFIGLTGGFPDPRTMQEIGVALPLKLLAVNIWLVIFNMIPAFPMDGGRILRALLAMATNHARATHIAATVGQAIAGCFFLWGLLAHQPMLVLIGIFVFFGAAQEAAFAQMKSASSGLRVSAAMVTHFQALALDATLHDAVDALLRTSQREFPVVDETGKVRGLLARNDLIVALRKTGAQTPVAEVMRVDIPSVHPTMLFDRAYALMQQCNCPALPVVDSADRLVGLFTPENIGELMMVKDALSRAPRSVEPRPAPPPLPQR